MQISVALACILLYVKPMGTTFKTAGKVIGGGKLTKMIRRRTTVGRIVKLPCGLVAVHSPAHFIIVESLAAAKALWT